MVPWNVTAFLSAHPLPYENWLGAAGFVKHRWPPGTSVFVNREYRPAYLGTYLGAAYPLASAFDPKAFSGGTMVVVDPGLRRNRPGAVIPPHAWEHRIPQVHNDAAAIYSAIPVKSHIARLTVAGQPIPAGLDRDAATQWTGPVQSALRSPLTVRIVPDEKRAFSALTLVTAPGELPLEFVVAVGTPEGERLVPRKRITMENDWLEVAFDGASVEWVEIRVRPSVYPKPFSIREAWLAP